MNKTLPTPLERATNALAESGQTFGPANVAFIALKAAIRDDDIAAQLHASGVACVRHFDSGSPCPGCTNRTVSRCKCCSEVCRAVAASLAAHLVS